MINSNRLYQAGCTVRGALFFLALFCASIPVHSAAEITGREVVNPPVEGAAVEMTGREVVNPPVEGAAVEITGREVAKAIDDRPVPEDFKADMTMVLTNSRGKTRESTLRSISSDDNTKQIIWFLSPKDDKGVAFLKIEKESEPDEMRLWLPAFKKIRRISSSKKGDAFMGSDISYEDMTSRNIDENDYRHLGREQVDGVDCHKLETTPRPEAESTYSKFITWVTADEYLPVKEKTFDKAGRHYKNRTLRYEQRDKYKMPVEIFVTNVQKDHTTRLTFDNIEVDTGVEESLFAEKNLKRLPR